jgi:hypothetical protein
MKIPPMEKHATIIPYASPGPFFIRGRNTAGTYASGNTDFSKNLIAAYWYSAAAPIEIMNRCP